MFDKILKGQLLKIIIGVLEEFKQDVPVKVAAQLAAHDIAALPDAIEKPLDELLVNGFVLALDSLIKLLKTLQ